MENILVSIRVRPLSKQETSKGNPWKLTPKSIALSSGGSASGQTYNFDRVFDPNSKTVDIYDTHTKKIISSAVQGFNGTIFAYGQTSSGKTYTMQGTSEEPGIIPLAIQDVFQNIQLAHNREFLLRVSYMEIYNEEIKDLLAPENCKLQIHENFEKGIFVAGLREEIVANPEQVFALMALGEANRHVGQTNMNVHSSRSHAIFKMVIESRDKSQDQDDPEDREILQNSDPVRVSHLNLVDLAGSERVAKTGAEGARLKEGSFINKSLMTLGNVINKLSEGIEKQGGHVPYRDSKLTRILQPALGGNARTVIICNLTPALVHIDESKGTLNFASRANRVTNCAKVNEILTDAALLKRQKKEIAELRQKLQNQESPSEQFEGEILNLRNELLKTELERERMALELQEFQKAQAERERRIKEQEQKIENLSTMVINSAVDDREFDKRSKRNNRRETWCARIQSGLPLLSDLERSPKKDAPKAPKTASSVFSLQVNRTRSFGLPPPFEALIEEDEDTLTSSSFGFQESFSIDDDFTLPEPGPQSSVADRRRRASDEYTGVFEVEEQLSDLQGQYDTLQCDYIIKMNEKDSEIDKLKRELAHTQVNLSKSGKDSHKKVQGPGKRSKSLDGWQESESLATIKQLRAQVGNLETEKLYMERELQSLANQAREQNEISSQELEEVYEELNLAKENCAKLESQLGMRLHGLQQLEMEKRNNEVLYSQLSSALMDFQTELDDIRRPCGGLQSSTDESLQHLTINVKAFQECVADARELNALGHSVHQNNDAKFLHLTSKAASYNLSGNQSVELDEAYGCDMVKKSYSDILRSCPNEQGIKAEEKPLARQDVQSLQGCVEDKMRTCLQVMEEEKRSLSEANLEVERNNVLSIVDSLRTQIEQASSEKEGLLLRKAIIQNELDNLKICLQVMEDEKSSLSGPNQKLEGIMKEHQSCKSPNSLQFPEQVRHEYAADSQVPVEESLTRMEAQLSKLKEENSSLSVSFASARRESELAAVELQTSALRESALEDKVESLKVALQSVEEERQKCMRASHEVAEELGRLETVVEKLAIQLAAGFEKCDQLYDIVEISGANDTLCKFEGQVDCAIDELKSVCKSVEALVVAVKQAASEEERLRRSKSALSDSKELHHVKSTLQLVEDKNTSLTKRLEEVQGVLLKESAFSEELHQLKLSLQSAEDENTSLTRRLEEIQGVLLRESAFSEELHQVKSSLQSAEDENISLKKRLEETQSVVQMASALSDQLHHIKSSLRSVADEKESLERRLEETQSELESRKMEINTIASKIRFSRPTQNRTEEQEELSSLVSEVERLIQEKETLEERVDVLHADVRLSRKEIDGLLSREASLEEQVASLRLSVEEKEDDKKLWMKIGEERLADIERHKAELLSTSKNHADAEEEISNLTSLLSEKLDEVDRLDKTLKAVEEEEGRLNKKLKDVEEEKNTLIRTADELDNQLQAFRNGASEALKEMEGWQQRYQTESTHYRAEITTLRKELSAAKSLSGSSTKERDGLHRDLEKTKSKMKDIEAKLKTTIQDKNKLETEKLNMERELKQLRQSTLLQRDISRRDSIVDQRRQSIVLGVNKTKSQLSSVEHALQLKTEELENLSYELSRSHDSYAKLEFAMAEAESYSNEKVAQLEEALATLKDEKDASIARIQSDVDAADEQLRAKSNELETLRVELVELTIKLQEVEGERNAASARATAVTKEKEDIVEGLLDAHISFERQKAELTIEAREHREKCNLLNKDIVLLTEDLDKVKKLREEASDANRLLQDQLKQALEDNTEKSLTHHKLVKDLEAHAESYKEQCRELQQHLESVEKQAHDLRFSGSQQLEELRLELQQCLMKLSTAKDEEQMLLTENRSLLVANTKLQFALDASRDRLEIFETRWDESDWELTEFKSLLQKAGFVRSEQWNLASLQQFAKRVKAQNNEARRLETELASKKMEMIDLEVNLETMKSQCDKYQEEIQYLKTKVLTPEQETGVREIVLENKKVKAQLKKTEEKAQELRELVKGKEVSLNALQATLGSIDAHNAKLQKDLSASKAELESLQQLHKIAMRAVAIGKSSTMSSSKPVRQEKLEPKATAQSTRSLPSNLFENGGSPVSRAESACTESSVPEYRVPLSEKPPNDSPPITERKRARLFPASERSKLSRSMGLGSLYFTLPQSRSQVDLNKENFTLH